MSIQKIYKIKNNSALNLYCQENSILYFFDDLNKNINVNIKIKCSDDIICRAYYYCLNKSKQKEIHINFKHGNNNNTLVNFVTIGANKSNTRIDIQMHADKENKNVIANQQINAILFDKSNCLVMPTMFIDTNLIKASHSVNIGYLNQDELFYLMSRKLNKQQATNMLISGLFSDIHNCENKQYTKTLMNNLKEFY